MKRFLYWVFSLLAVLLVLEVAYEYFWNTGQPQEVDASPSWQSYSYDKYRFSLESPMPLLMNKRALANPKIVSRKLSLYADSPDQNFHLTVESQEYRGPVPADHLDQFQGKVVGMFQSNETVQDFKYASGPVTCSGLTGLEVSGTYASQGTPYRFDVIEVSEGDWSWDLETAFLDKSDLDDEAKRIFQSLKIEN
ncbi:MAG TPA: hypothetical protein VK859_17255 [bacterium]|nr:hypothetical protein [bacterium]